MYLYYIQVKVTSHELYLFFVQSIPATSHISLSNPLLRPNHLQGIKNA